MESSQSNPETKQQSRDYKCPCGKTYLSNAAIFTHIKQKHAGVVLLYLYLATRPYWETQARKQTKGQTATGHEEQERDWGW